MMGYLYSDDFATEMVDCETMKTVKQEYRDHTRDM